MFEASLYSTFLQKRVTCRCLDNSHPDRYQMTSYCACDLHFSDDEWLWASFHGPVCHLYVFFWKNVYSGCYDHFSIRLFFFINLNFMISLYILDINPLSEISFSNIPSYLVNSLFHLVGSFLCCTKAFYSDVIPFVYFHICFPCLRKYI